MASVPSTTLGPVGTMRAADLDTALDGAWSVRSVTAFDAAMSRQYSNAQFAQAQHVQGQLAQGQAVQAPNATQPVAATTPSAAVDSTQGGDALRTRRALELDGARAPGTRPADGDAILGGLQTLRGQFDKSLSRVNGVLASSGVDTKTMLAMQVEVVNFTMLVDMTSKLTGKSTQTFDSLMKGQ